MSRVRVRTERSEACPGRGPARITLRVLRRKKKRRSNRPLRGQGPYSMFYSPAPWQERALRGEHRHPQVHRCSTQPSEKPFGRRPLKLLKNLRGA